MRQGDTVSARRFCSLPHSLTPSLPSKGQAVVEYAILIGVVTVAIVGMQTYAKRGLQAGIKLAADQLGDQRQGASEIDLSVDWKKKGDSKIATTTHASGTNPKAPATRIVESNAGGARVYRTDEVTTSSGLLSSTLGAERGQQ